MKMNIEHHWAERCRLCAEKLGRVYKADEVDEYIDSLNSGSGNKGGKA